MSWRLKELRWDEVRSFSVSKVKLSTSKKALWKFERTHVNRRPMWYSWAKWWNLWRCSICFLDSSSFTRGGRILIHQPIETVSCPWWWGVATKWRMEGFRTRVVTNYGQDHHCIEVLTDKMQRQQYDIMGCILWWVLRCVHYCDCIMIMLISNNITYHFNITKWLRMVSQTSTRMSKVWHSFMRSHGRADGVPGFVCQCQQSPLWLLLRELASQQSGRKFISRYCHPKWHRIWSHAIEEFCGGLKGQGHQEWWYEMVMYPTSPSRPYSHLIRARHAYWGNWCGMTRIESSTMKKHWPIQNHATRRRVLYKYIVDYCNMWIDESSKDLMVNWDTTLHKKSIHDLSLKLPWRCEGTKHGDMQSVFRENYEL
jgi:hypothetical protein